MRAAYVCLPLGLALAAAGCADREALSDEPEVPAQPAGPSMAAGPAVAPASGTCASCVAVGATWCANPRRCMRPGEPCGGLVLRDAAACVNDTPPMPASGPAPEGLPIGGWLNDFPGVRFTVMPGSCYSVGFEIGAGSSPLLVVPLTKLTTPGETLEERGDTLTARRVGRSRLFCPTYPGTMSFSFVSDPAHNLTRNAGNGTVSVQLFRAQAPPRPVATPAPLDPNRYTLPAAVAPAAPAAPKAAAPWRGAPQDVGPVYTGDSCLRTCFLDRNRCVGRCSRGGESGSDFRGWCADECEHRQDSCKQSCIDR